MDKLFYKFQLNPETWVYVSSIALIALFFKFSRVLSVRNLDLLGLIALSPGLLLVSHGRANPPSATLEASGFFVLFGVGLFFLCRLIGDVFMTRRPLLEPNLSQGGLMCVAVALMVFLAGRILGGNVPPSEAPGDARLHFAILDLLSTIPSHTFPWVATGDAVVSELTAQILCVLAHGAVAAGLFFIGARHFGNAWTGVAVATLYLLLPYTVQMAGRPHHVVPAALLVWMLALFRHPTIAGSLLGLCIGFIYYPAFLLPLWVSFYSRRGAVRFLAGVVATLVAIALAVALFKRDRLGMFIGHFGDMFNLTMPHGEGLWAMWHPATRLPLTVLFCCFALGMLLWPARKNLGTLISCSAALMLATQFWYPQGGLLYMNWYLPLLLLTIFRPNLEHRVATSSVSVRRVRRRRQLGTTKEVPA